MPSGIVHVIISVYSCSECMFDFWGATCEYICSQNCVPVVNGHVCDKDDAACMSGCMPGYWREDCNRECPNCLNDVCQIADGNFFLSEAIFLFAVPQDITLSKAQTRTA